uniref:Endonuclease/exonuclease/phosphatase domain-containing protein n=1 Tax=Homalodisca liturata TaxID=320908 RepID=A0A1B6IHJ5_9HEMI
MNSLKETSFKNSLFTTIDSSDLIIVHQNIRSLRSNFDDFLVFLESLKRKPDIIVLTEIWISDSEVVQYNLPTFLLHVQCNNKYRAGGVALFVFDQLNCVRQVKTTMATADVVHLHFKLERGIAVDLLAVYRLQAFSINMFNDEFQNTLSCIKSANFIVKGDLNINLLDTSIRSVEDYLILMASHGLNSLVNEPTRINNHSETCIDHVFCRSKFDSSVKYTAEVLKINITDHWMTVLGLNIKNNCISRITKNCFEHVSVNLNTLKLVVSQENWLEIYNCTSISDAFEMFLIKIQSYVSVYTNCVNVSNKFLKPWVDASIVKAVKEKNNLYKKVVKRPNDVNLNCC